MTFPIVLAHGIARFDILAHKAHKLLGDEDERDDDSTHYFRRIKSTLIADGFHVHHSSVSWAKGVTVRAREFKKNVEHILHEGNAPKVHIIAHSMGGLDARHLLFEHQDDAMHEKVAPVTTIGTPHLGTSFADWGIENKGKLLKLLVDRS